MNITLGKKIGVGFALVLLAFAIFAAITFWQIAELVETERRVAHTREVISEIETIAPAVSEIGFSVRGYMLTGDEEQTESFDFKRPELTQSLARLRSMTADNAVQQGQIARLAQQLETFFAYYEQQIAERKRGGLDAAVAFAKTGEGQKEFDTILTIVAEMKDLEVRLLEERIAAAQRTATRIRQTLAVTAALALILGLGAAILITRRITGPVAQLVHGAGEIGGGSFCTACR